MFDPNLLTDVISKEMPYGKYKGYIFCDLPMYYLEWIAKNGFPNGKLGQILSTIYEIKLNGLDYIITNLKYKK